MIEMVDHQPSVVASEIPIVCLPVSVLIMRQGNSARTRQIVFRSLPSRWLSYVARSIIIYVFERLGSPHILIDG